MTHEEFEKIVMEKLLDGPEEILHQLRNQYVSARIVSREFTGHGFFTKFDISDDLADSKVNGKIDDVIARFKDPLETEYFILYVEEGKIDTLEGFCTLDDWNDNYTEARIEHCFEDKREYDIS